MNAMEKKDKVEPIIEPEGYASCPNCGYFDLIPEHLICPKCSIKLNWDWFERMKIRK